jgi:hypothetical protein
MYAWLAFSMMCQRIVTAGPDGFAAAAGDAAGEATGEAGEATGEAGTATVAAGAVAGEAAAAAGFVSAGLVSAGFGVGGGAAPPQAVNRTLSSMAIRTTT